MKVLRFFSIIFIFLLLVQSVFSLGKKDKSTDNSENEPAKEEKLPNESITLDLLLDTKKQNPKNHFNWKTSSNSSKTSNSSSSTKTENSYKDYFDAVSGASKLHSTKYFRDFSLDSTKKNLRTPKGLRNLCLYAVANPEMLSNDNFSVKKEGKKLTITFTHRENLYKIETDEKGIINVPNGFFIKVKEKPADTPKTEPAESQNTEENSQQSAPEEAQPAESAIEYQKDEPPESVTAVFKGKLTANLTNEGIFTLKGKLKLEKREEPKKSEAALTENTGTIETEKTLN